MQPFQVNLVEVSQWNTFPAVFGLKRLITVRLCSISINRSRLAGLVKPLFVCFVLFLAYLFGTENVWNLATA